MVSAYPKYSEGCVCLFTSWAFLPVTLSTCTGAVCCLLCVGSETMNDFHEAPNLDRYFLCSCGCYSQYTVNIGCGVQKSINVSAAQSWISRTLIFIIVDIYVKWNLWDHGRDAYALRPPPPIFVSSHWVIWQQKQGRWDLINHVTLITSSIWWDVGLWCVLFAERNLHGPVLLMAPRRSTYPCRRPCPLCRPPGDFSHLVFKLLM